MTIIAWIMTYACSALFWLWILKWGGAKRIEGWMVWALIGWFAGHWSAEQIKLYALIAFIIETIWFGAGFFSATARMAFIHT